MESRLMMTNGASLGLALVVDDNPEVLEVTRRMLRDIGYEVITAGAFQRARDLLRSEPIDLLVTDVRLREFNGLQLAIEARQTNSDVCIVIITAWHDPSLFGQLSQIRAMLCKKPFTQAALSQAIDAAGQLP
jgi:two-component system NtrC family sensor kinase